MRQNLLSFFGSANERVENGLAALKNGKGVLVVDDDDRENEGDMIFAAEALSVEQMAMLIREGSGIVCLCLTGSKAQELELRQTVENNTSSYGTAFTVSVEAASGVSTGVSAQDRVTTIKAAVASGAKAQDLSRPGHVFPLVARDGGVLERQGHTEASVDLARLAGYSPYGVLCELTNPDGSMARLPEIAAFALKNGMPLLSVQDIISYRQERGI